MGSRSVVLNMRGGRLVSMVEFCFTLLADIISPDSKEILTSRRHNFRLFAVWEEKETSNDDNR